MDIRDFKLTDRQIAALSRAEQSEEGSVVLEVVRLMAVKYEKAMRGKPELSEEFERDVRAKWGAWKRLSEVLEAPGQARAMLGVS
ncbi:MAG: hypothetical protein ABFD89_06970 [Bryobacteraceae bacterium]